MPLPHRVLRGSGHPRGQGLVELAVILPLLALLLLMAIDFGRVFFGWIALENAARIGADHAAAHALAWTNTSPTSMQVRAQYQQLVLDDLESINCNPDPSGSGDPVPDPVFTNPDGTTTGNVHESGDHAVVTLDCEFGLLTPLAESLFGGPVPIRAQAIFPINAGAVLGLPSAPEPPPGCLSGLAQVPDMVDMTVGQARSAWSDAGFTGSFTPSNGQTNKTVTTQTTNPPSSPGDCIADTATVTVTYQ